MEQITEDITKYREMKDSTLHAYKKGWARLAKGVEGKPLTSPEFLKDYKKVVAWFKPKSLSTQKAYLAGIMVLISPKGKWDYLPGYADVGKKYGDLLTQHSKTYEKKIFSQQKSAQQDEKWVTLAELEKVRRTYQYYIRKLGYNQTNNTFKPGKERKHQELFQKYIVASLYLLHPPRRNAYATMKVIKVGDFNELDDSVKDENNYLVVVSRNTKYFHFADYKTRKTKGVFKYKVKGPLNRVLNLWLKFNTTGSLLLNSRGKEMKPNTLTKFLQKTFEPTGKKISSQMIRTIKLSEHYGTESSNMEKKELADAMGHSVATQQKFYIKKE